MAEMGLCKCEVRRNKNRKEGEHQSQTMIFENTDTNVEFPKRGKRSMIETLELGCNCDKPRIGCM